MDRSLFLAPALEVAPQLLGSFLTVVSDLGAVTVRLTEVEAYHGVGVPGPYDPGSHSRDRKTERNASMFGSPGHAYVYLSYGIHFALNMVCSAEGSASGVLIRAGEVVEGRNLAEQRRSANRAQSSLAAHQLARGPGNLAQALGITRPDHDGRDLFDVPFSLASPKAAPTSIKRGPRVGVSGIAGSHEFPWRFWVAGEKSVSAYRAAQRISDL